MAFLRRRPFSGSLYRRRHLCTVVWGFHYKRKIKNPWLKSRIMNFMQPNLKRLNILTHNSWRTYHWNRDAERDLSYFSHSFTIKYLFHLYFKHVKAPQIVQNAIRLTVVTGQQQILAIMTSQPPFSLRTRALMIPVGASLPLGLYLNLAQSQPEVSL